MAQYHWDPATLALAFYQYGDRPFTDDLGRENDRQW